MLSATDAKIIASNGGGIDVDASAYSATDFKIIATNGQGRKAPLIIRNASRLSATDMKIIAANSPGNVIFVL